MKIIITLICLLFFTSSIFSNSTKLSCAGCKTAYYLMKSLVKPYSNATKNQKCITPSISPQIIKVRDGVKLTPAKSGNKIGIKLLLANKIDFAFTCKPLSLLIKKLHLPKEKTLNLKCIKIARDPLVIILNRSVGISNLTKKQLSDIYLEKITNWKEVGGKDLPITIIALSEEVETSVNVLLAEMILNKKVLFLSDKVKRFLSPKKVGDVIRKTKGALGCLARNSYRIRYGALSNIDSISPSNENILNGSYHLFVSYYLIFNSKKDNGTKDFLSYLQSKDGKKEVNSIMVSE